MQASQLLESLAIGVSIAAIPGPVFIELTRRTLAEGFASGAWLATGELVGNLSILLGALALSSLVASNPVRLGLSLLGALILIRIGIGAWTGAGDVSTGRDGSTGHHRGPVLTGLSLALCSPITIGLWLSLSVSYLQPLRAPVAVISNGFLIAIGFMALFVPLAAFIARGRERLPEAFSGLLSKAFAIVLIGYGISFAGRFGALAAHLS